MAKAIVIRRIRYLPANPAGKLRTIDINEIESVTISPMEKPGKTRITLKSGQCRYSSEDVFEICRAIGEAKDG